MEVGVAMVLLAVAMMLVVQLGYWSVRHRTRIAARFVALELAANILEEARSVPWDDLTDEWAETQSTSPDFAIQLPDGKLAVHIERLESPVRTKRVHVELSWLPHDAGRPHTVHLVSLFSARAATAEDVEP
jgi:hypothetical protein